MDAFAYLKQTNERIFHYIFVAPPQYKNLWKDTLQTIDENIEILSEDGWVIAQIHPIEEDNLNINELRNLDIFDRRDYGSTLLLFFNRRGL